MKNMIGTKNQTSKRPFFVNLRHASPQAMEILIKAMNAEVNEAIAQKKVPTLEGAHGRLFSDSLSLQ